MKDINIIKVKPDNILEYGVYCLKNQKNQGFQRKYEWFLNQYDSGLRIKILENASGEQLGFIEYIPIENAWRPAEGNNYLFIQCIFIYPKKNTNIGLGSLLISDCIHEAISKDYNGVAVMTSKGAWMADKSLFIKNNFVKVDTRDRFELLSYKINPESENPSLIDWTKNQKDYIGWHIVYANQCPYHEKSVFDLNSVAEEYNIPLNISKLESPSDIKEKSPSGFGVFALLHDCKLLEDHYISKTRFKNIINKELSL